MGVQEIRRPVPSFPWTEVVPLVAFLAHVRPLQADQHSAAGGSESFQGCQSGAPGSGRAQPLGSVSDN